MRTVGAIVLAAGGSTRLGQPKQLLVHAGETLIRRAVRIAIEGGCSPIVVVTGNERELLEIELHGTGAQIVHNPDWPRGIGTSIRRGLEPLLHLDAVVLLACDQPFLEPTIIRALLTQNETSGHPIAACRYAATLGIPALFAQSCFPALMNLPDESGAKPIIEANPNQVAQVECAAAAIDIDTPADLAKLRGTGGSVCAEDSDRRVDALLDLTIGNC